MRVEWWFNMLKTTKTHLHTHISTLFSLIILLHPTFSAVSFTWEFVSHLSFVAPLLEGPIVLQETIKKTPVSQSDGCETHWETKENFTACKWERESCDLRSTNQIMGLLCSSPTAGAVTSDTSDMRLTGRYHGDHQCQSVRHLNFQLPD